MWLYFYRAPEKWIRTMTYNKEAIMIILRKNTILTRKIMKMATHNKVENSCISNKTHNLCLFLKIFH